MEVRTYKVYKFEELPEETQQKVIEKYYDINVDDYYWWQYEWWDTDIFDLDFSKVYFDLDRDQYMNVTDAIKIKDEAKFYDLLGLDKKIAEKYLYRFYNHSSDTNTHIEFDRDDPELEETEEELEALEKAKEKFDDLMYDWIKLLREQYEYMTSEEAIKDNLISNDYDFTEKGEID